MKTYRLLSLLPFLLVMPAAADKFELKDGSTIEGTIVKEEGSDYIISVQVTKSIKDERRIPKATVVRQFTEQKDETAFAELAKFIPAPDLQPAETYEAQLVKVEAFIKAHKDSPRRKEVDKIYDTLQDELAVVKSGGVKFGGKMISADQRAPKAYALDASILASNIKKAGDRNELLTALREWSRLEKDYQGSKAYRDTIPYAVNLMKAHLANVNTSLSGYDAAVKQRETGLSRMSQEERRRSEEAIAEEKAQYTARIEKEKADGVKWFSLSPYAKTQLDDAKRNLDTEIRRLGTLDTTNLPKTEEAYEEAYKAVTTPGATKQQIDSALSKVRGSTMPAAYLEILTKAAPAAPAQ
jgi:hypothetical protein